MQIRPLTIADLDMICALEEVSQPYPWTRENIAEELTEKAQNIFSYVGLNHNEEPQTYVMGRKVVDELWILQVGTDPQYRRQGLSRQLLEFVLVKATNHKLHQAVLEVRANNEAAIGLYEHLSFTQDGYRPQYYPSLQEGGPKEDALLMSKSLH
jgi:ribosomal-protein-alanine N-acetyltransferase